MDERLPVACLLAMNWLSDHLFQLTLIAVYLAVLVHHALIGRRHSNSLDGYLVAGRRMGGFVIALSFYATRRRKFGGIEPVADSDVPTDTAKCTPGA